MLLYHGSERRIEKPQFMLGKEHNDYGRGFYCTQDLELAKEWACKDGRDGYANSYLLDAAGLKILNLADEQYSVLNWIAILLNNRTFSLQDEISIDARDYVIENFGIDTRAFDVVIGYRADDSYFAYAQSFIGNALPVRSLAKAMMLGNLGIQVALVSERAFAGLKHQSAEFADKSVYHERFLRRDSDARRTFREELRKSRMYRDDIFVMDILREGIRNEDVRLR